MSSQATTRVKNPDDGGTCECSGHYWWRPYCAAYVCDRCDDHKGLARCFCGWRSGQNRIWINGKIIVDKNSGGFNPEHIPEKPEGEDSDYFGDEPVDEDGCYRD